jgi:O-antigen ligase
MQNRLNSPFAVHARLSTRYISEASNLTSRGFNSSAVSGSAGRVDGVVEVKNEPALSWWAHLFLITLIIPWIITLGPSRLSVSRLVLLLTIIPCLLMWFSGKAGKIRVADILIIFFCLWSFVSLTVVHGLDTSMQSATIIVVETMGSYFLARVCVRNSTQFRSMVLTITCMILLLVPFSFYESVTGNNRLLSLFGMVLPTQMDYAMAQRFGLRRVQSVFDHPILSGVFSLTIFPLTHVVLGYGASIRRRWTWSGLVFLSTLLSMSSGPLSAIVLQTILLTWNWVFRCFQYRWWVILAVFAVPCLVISIFSNQSIFEFYVHYFAFSQDTGWDRIRIWHFGWQSVINHPLFGIGYNEYERPEWMEASIDMFWLVNFICFGYPGGLFMLLAFLSIVVGTALKSGLTGKSNAYRTAFVICAVGIFTVGWTVHFWNTPYLLIMFCLGSASWILDEHTPDDGERRKKLQGSRKAGTIPRSPQPAGGAGKARKSWMQGAAGGTSDGSAEHEHRDAVNAAAAGTSQCALKVRN